MSTTYLGINYWPQNVNFYESDAVELAEAQYGIKASAAIGKLVCKIYKEGYFIRWGEEQSLIFSRKLGGEMNPKVMKGIVEILLDKKFFDREMYEQHSILTSSDIQTVWMEATSRRKKDWNQLPYLLVSPTKGISPVSAQQVVDNQEENVDNGNEKADDFKEKGNNSPQSKEKQSKGEQSTESKEEESIASPLIEIPEYAHNSSTHNLRGLQERLENLHIVQPKQVNAILRLTNYGRKETLIWKLLANTDWGHINAPGSYIITSLTNQGRKS